VEALVIACHVIFVVVCREFVFTVDTLPACGALDILFATIVVIATVNGLKGLQLRVAPRNHQAQCDEQRK